MISSFLPSFTSLISTLRSGWVGSVYRKFVPVSIRAWMHHLKMERSRRQHAFEKTAAWSNSPLLKPCSVNGISEHFGVNVVGYLRAEFGLGESARNYGRALECAGVSVTYLDLDIGLQHSQGDTQLEGRIGHSRPHPISLLFVNPDHMKRAMGSPGMENLGHVIGCWFWELEKLPLSWKPALDFVDELMVATSFIESAVRSDTDKNVLRVPLPLNSLVDSGLGRDDFGIDSSAFVFLFTFDFASWLERKNPLAVVRAFKSAFPASRRNVQLVIKSSNGHRTPQWMESLTREIGNDQRIIFKDETIAKRHLSALQRCADAFVSLHRAEGFGLGLAECMAFGKPVVATGWSGNMDFMDSESACLVDYDLVPVPLHAYIDDQGQRWAEPREESAVYWMKRLADDPEFARRKGKKGQAKIEAYLKPEVAIEPLKVHLRQLSSKLESPISEISNNLWTNQ